MTCGEYWRLFPQKNTTASQCKGSFHNMSAQCDFLPLPWWGCCSGCVDEGLLGSPSNMGLVVMKYVVSVMPRCFRNTTQIQQCPGPPCSLHSIQPRGDLLHYHYLKSGIRRGLKRWCYPTWNRTLRETSSHSFTGSTLKSREHMSYPGPPRLDQKWNRISQIRWPIKSIN